MNQYIWEEPGFYSAGVILVVAHSLEDAIIRLKTNRLDCWFCVQTGRPIKTYYEALMKHAQDQLENGNILLIDKISKYRAEILSSKQLPQCIEHYTNCPDAEILGKNIDFCDFLSQEFLENNMENHKSKWFMEPTKILGIDEIFVKECVD